MKKFVSLLVVLAIFSSSVFAHSRSNIYWSDLMSDPISTLFADNYFSVNAVGGLTTKALVSDTSTENNLTYGGEFSYYSYFFQSSYGFFAKTSIMAEETDGDNLLSGYASTGLSFRFKTSEDVEIFLSAGPAYNYVLSPENAAENVSLFYLGGNYEIGFRYTPFINAPGFKINAGIEANSLWLIASDDSSVLGEDTRFEVNPFIGFTFVLYAPDWTNREGTTINIY